MSFQTNIASKLFAACAPILLILVCWQPLKASSDIWAHAAVGRWIVQHHQIPHNALFLWSYTGHWTAHSWLAEIGTYEIMRLGGELGGPVLMVMLSTLAALTAFGIVLWSVVKNGEMPTAAAVMFVAGLTAATGRFAPRPELFTTVFTAIVCATLLNLPIKPTQRDFLKLTWIPLLFILWTNLHGAVLFGLACLWLISICDSLQHRGRWGLVGIAALSTVALVVNPSGLGYLNVFAPLAHQSFTYIDEWRPFWQSPQPSIGIPISELILLIGALTAWRLGGQRRLAEIGLLALSTAAFLSARRNMDLMALICLLVFCRNYAAAAQSEFVARIQAKINVPRLTAFGTSLVGAYFVYLLVVCTSCVIKAPFAKTTGDNIPTIQASMISAFCPEGTRVLNLYDSAAYLEWKLDGHQPLIIDGMNAYPNSVYDDWVQIWNATPRGLAMLDADHVGCVAGGPIITGQPLPPLYGYLANDKSWRLIYAGDDGPVFVKESPVAINFIRHPERSRGNT